MMDNEMAKKRGVKDNSKYLGLIMGRTDWPLTGQRRSTRGQSLGGSPGDLGTRVRLEISHRHSGKC